MESARKGGGGISDGLLLSLFALLLCLTVLVWTATGLSGLFAHGAWPRGVAFTGTPSALRSLATAPTDLPAAWPATPPAELSGYGLFWGLLIGEAMILMVLAVFTLGTVARWRAVRARRKAGAYGTTPVRAPREPAGEEPVGEPVREPVRGPVREPLQDPERELLRKPAPPAPRRPSQAHGEAQAPPQAPVPAPPQAPSQPELLQASDPGPATPLPPAPAAFAPSPAGDPSDRGVRAPRRQRQPAARRLPARPAVGHRRAQRFPRRGVTPAVTWGFARIAHASTSC